MNIRKTQRKNKTGQVINWPSHDEYFTIEELKASNPHMLTTTSSDITLRVRLSKAISENVVAEIGQKNSGKGRPLKVYTMMPVKQTSINKASTDGISVNVPSITPIMEISTQPMPSVNPTMSPVESVPAVV